jgi:Tfp pilus assembly protein PilF
MFRKKKENGPAEEWIPVPAELPPVAGMDEEEKESLGRGPLTWLWTLIAAVAVMLLAVYVVVMGVIGFYDGLKDRAIENKQLAQEHYERGLSYLEDGEYELAIGEFDMALRNDSGLSEAEVRLEEAKELAGARAKPTSETRKDAADLLYRQAVAHYESGNLQLAVAVLDELRGLDPEYQQENVEMMLTTSHFQLGLTAVAEDRMEDAAAEFSSVLDLDPDDADAQDQLNLVDLYTVALNNWERDWAATIQAFKGLYALAPDYKDVATRLRNAYIFRAQTYVEDEDWCQAYEDFAAAVEMMPIEATVDRRDDALIRCEIASEQPTVIPTSIVAARPTAKPTTGIQATPTAQSTSEEPEDPVASATAQPVRALGDGRIAFTSYDSVRQRNDIYVVDLSEGDAKLLQENGSQPTLAPGGQRLAFRNLDPLHLGLALLDSRSGEVFELTAHVEDSSPAWSPDAGQVVFASNKHGDRKWRLYVTSRQEVRGEGEEWAFGQAPAWSPDGSRIAYHGCDERGDDCGLWLMDPGGFDPSRLTTDPSDTAPAWSPDSTKVAFTSVRTGNWDLWMVDLTTGKTTQLTNHSAPEVAPTWSPDGSRLAFLSAQDGIWGVYVLDLESGNVVRIIATGDAYPDPVSEGLSWVP